MRKRQWLRTPSVYAAALALALTCACSRRLGLGGNNETGQSHSHDLPFHGETEPSPGESASHPSVPDQYENSSALPFASSSAVLPAGTMLTVQLVRPLTISRHESGKTFIATAEPVIVDGRTIIPPDAEVKGRVESAHMSITKRHTGYIRLTLDSVRIGDKQILLPTSSLFARASIDSPHENSAEAPGLTHPIASRPGTIRLQKGRRLTFRLTSGLDLSKPTAVSDDKTQSGTK